MFKVLYRFGNTRGGRILCEVSGLHKFLPTLMNDLSCISTWLTGSCACRLRIQQENPVPKKTPAQKLAESWRTVEQIKRLNPEEYDEVN
jgi:hypothetical protein